MHSKANYVLSARDFIKTLQITKTIAALLFIIAILQCGKTNAQSITLSEHNQPVQTVFKEVWKQSGLQFVYTNKILEGAKPITINVKNASLSEVLRICFKGQPFIYTQTDKAIILQRKEVQAVKISSEKGNSEGEVHGFITDSTGKPLEGASIVVKGSKYGTLTNSRGEYILENVPEMATLVFSYIGMVDQEVKVDGRASISVVLKSQASTMDDIVVIGYGKQKREFLTASISTVTGAELVKSPVANLSTALKGQLAGLVALQSSGKPGSDGSTLTVRGIGTYTGNNAPLILVDGIARDTYDDIDPNEVATISVLRDASATAVYGVRGANGVILITTKRGSIGAPKISLTGQTAISSFTNVPSFANSYDYATLINEKAKENYWVNHANDPDITTWDQFLQKRDANWTNDGSLTYSADDLKYFQNAHTPKLANGQPNPLYDPYFHPDVDWKQKLFKKYAPMVQGNANISGGSKFMKYFVSLGYLNQGGLFKTDYMAYPNQMQFSKNRYNLRGNFDFDVTSDLKIAVNIGTEFVTITGMDNDDYIWEKKILWSSPMSSPGMINGRYVENITQGGNDQYNPMYAMESEDSWNVTNNSILNSSINAVYKLDRITRGLSIKGLASYDSYFSSRSYGKYVPILWQIRPNPSGDKLDPIYSQFNDAQPPTINSDFNLAKWRKLYGELSLNYDRSFGAHTFSGLILASREKKFDPTLEYDLPHAYEGLTSRVNYNYAGKYILEYDMGYNGSENFPDGKRFGYFPSYSAAWLLSNESFFHKNDLINFVKLKGSYGEVGNDNITPAGSSTPARYLYLPDTWKQDGGYNFGDLNNRHYINGVDENVIGNPNVTWEVSKEMNLALEMHFFKDKLSVTYEYFRNHRSNILSYRGTVPSIVAANLPPYNLGSVESWGSNIEFTYNDHVGDFNFYIRGNGAIAKNKILYQDEAILPGFEYQAATGRPVGQQLLLKSEGLYTSWSQLYNIDNNGNPILSQPVLALKNGKPYTNGNGQPVYQKDLGYGGSVLQPGNIRFEDVNGDGVIDDKDKIRTGQTANPEYNFGVTLGFNYKGFDVSALFAGIAGVARGGMSEAHINKQQAIFAVDLNRFSLDRYNAGDKIDFPIADYNQNAAGAGAYNAGSTFFNINTSYVRLQNLAIGYTFRGLIMKKIGIQSTRLYVTGDNLYTWSANKIWGDPENLGNIGYPLTKTYNVGINVNF
ncbi:MAG TPA: TonB-dependent receptor [Arachidicoccus soli]|nr:TonB-dependent receptor [Arachidicoccus soli]